MDSEKMLFEKGCFLPSWIEDNISEEPPIQQFQTAKHKDLNTLLKELEEIKQHIQDVKEREWQLAYLLNFHTHRVAKD